MIFAIGSFAAHAHKPDIWPKYQDLDIICTWESFQGFLNSLDLNSCTIPFGNKMISKRNGFMIETEIAWKGSSAFDFINMKQDLTLSYFEGIPIQIPSLDWLYAFKMSHRYLKNSPHFNKSRKDIKTFREMGCIIPNKEWLKKREKETYSYNHPSLKKSKQEFFSGDMIEYVWDHDSIHESMKHLKCPAYLYYKKDGQEVECDRTKWENLPTLHKLYGVLEEVYVLALERSQIPHPNVDPLLSFTIALEKVCTSITSGWFREFAYNHYDEVYALYDEEYVKKFWKDVQEGKVKKHVG